LKLHHLKLKKALVFFDIESTGIDTVNDRIVELCIIKYHPDHQVENYIKRFNPEMPISPLATRVHGITNEDVKDCPTFISLAHEVHQFMQGADVCGYNIMKFDLPLITEELMRANINEPFTADTKYVDAFKIFASKERRDLSSALKFYTGATLENAHSALADTEATAEVLNGQIAKYNLDGSIEALHEISNQGLDIVDYDGKFSRDEQGELIFTFGTNKGKRIAENHGMLKWMLDKEFSRHTKYIAQKILNGELK
jgi:DNA polymerase-3 subunit epsilon